MSLLDDAFELERLRWQTQRDHEFIRVMLSLLRVEEYVAAHREDGPKTVFDWTRDAIFDLRERAEKGGAA